jgi:hypothetical protein
MLCPDVMELVGQEVLKVREVSMNIARYNSVVCVMKDTFREVYKYVGCHYSVGGCHYSVRDELCMDAESYGSSFISDFKKCIYDYLMYDYLVSERWSTSEKWSRGWGPYYEYSMTNERLYAEVPTANEIRAANIRFEIYGNKW